MKTLNQKQAEELQELTESKQHEMAASAGWNELSEADKSYNLAAAADDAKSALLMLYPELA